LDTLHTVTSNAILPLGTDWTSPVEVSKINPNLRAMGGIMPLVGSNYVIYFDNGFIETNWGNHNITI
jgi:hypothetical protein